MFKRLLKIIIGIALLPVCVGFSVSFYYLLTTLGGVGRTEIFFLSGVVSYIVLYFSSLKLNFVYVLGHETTHAILAILCGGKIKAFKVSKKGGSVATTKSNIIISLGPYFIPIYTILFAAGFFVCGYFFQEAYRYINVFIFIIGFSISFHFLMTINSLFIEQPDIVENGHLFSLAFIYIINIMVLGVLLGLVFDRSAIAGFFKQSAVEVKNIVMFIWMKIPRQGG